MSKTYKYGGLTWCGTAGNYQCIEYPTTEVSKHGYQTWKLYVDDAAVGTTETMASACQMFANLLTTTYLPTYLSLQKNLSGIK